MNYDAQSLKQRDFGVPGFYVKRRFSTAVCLRTYVVLQVKPRRPFSASLRNGYETRESVGRVWESVGKCLPPWCALAEPRIQSHGGFICGVLKGRTFSECTLQRLMWQNQSGMSPRLPGLKLACHTLARIFFLENDSCSCKPGNANLESGVWGSGDYCRYSPPPGSYVSLPQFLRVALKCNRIAHARDWTVHRDLHHEKFRNSVLIFLLRVTAKIDEWQKLNIWAGGGERYERGVARNHRHPLCQAVNVLANHMFAP